MAQSIFHIVVALLVFVPVCAVSAGCSDSAPPEGSPHDRASERPLQPLVYTEDPDHSPEAAAARNRRLMRELLHVSDEEGAWGRLETESAHRTTPLGTAEDLGETIFRALVERDDTAWDELFVSPRNYASLVDVDLEEARRFVDDKQAGSRQVRRAFVIDKPSEAPNEGLASVFEFERLELGDGRALDGDRVDDEAQIAQHWDNSLYLGHADSEVEFRLRIPKIVRIHLPTSDGTPAVRLGVASDIRFDSQLAAFLEAGLHLKPSLLRSYDYPIPLEVGNYWRYARRLPDRDEDDREDRLEVPDELGASGVTMRVESVDRFGARRLVHLRFVYNDADLTRRDEYWLITPRRVYLCPRPCRRRVDDLGWLLSYLPRQTAILRFPLRRGEAWGGSETEPVFEVDDQWHEVEVAGGSFFGTFAVDGLGPLADRGAFHRLRGARRYVAPSTGIVQRSYRFGDDEGDTIVESLVDYRIMPR